MNNNTDTIKTQNFTGKKTTSVTYESDLLPEIQSGDGEMTLAKAIIKQAVDDTMSKKQATSELNAGIDAYIWIVKPAKEFLSYMKILDRDPQVIIDYVKKNSGFNYLEATR